MHREILQSRLRPWQLAPAVCLVWMVLLGPGAWGQATEQRATLLDGQASWCTIFRALSLQIPAECRTPLHKGVVFTAAIPAAPASCPASFTTTRIQFNFDSSALRPESYLLLDLLATVLNDARMANQTIRIEGHTDSVGPLAYNRHLSQQRALAVQRYLHTSHGIPFSRLPTLGKGPDEPYDPAYPTAAINRRVQFTNLSAACLQG